MTGHGHGWATEELAEVNLGDKRLNTRLIKLCDRFSDAPESPINQACADWAETKAAYRFFQNDNVEAEQILAAHCNKTAQRARAHKTVLALQDTSYFIYTGHPKTEGIGRLSAAKGNSVDKIYTRGLMVHTCLAVTTAGVPLGLLDQKIYTRNPSAKKTGKTRHRDYLPVEEKESCKWLETMKNSKTVMGDAEIVTVCDREADLYDFFKCSHQLGSPVLVRAKVNRTINRKSRYSEKGVEKLREHMSQQPEAGSYNIDIPRRAKTKQCKSREARTAAVTVRYSTFTLPPPCDNIKHATEKLPDLRMYAVYVQESKPPNDAEPVEWMLLTNIAVTSYQEAYEKVQWYCLRWRIEMYFKVLKSGFRVEECRLGHADRLARYLTVMSIVAWRLFMITLIARADPQTPCNAFLSQQEWSVLFLKTNRKKPVPENPPHIDEIVLWIGKLGGYLGRKCDGPPGTITLWRGWKRLADLTEGWHLALQT